MTTFKNFSLRYAKPLWGFYAAGFVTLAVVNILTLEIPQLAKTIINDLTGATAHLDQAAHTALIIIALGFLMMLIRALSRILIFWPGRRIEADTKSDLFARVLRLPQVFLVKFGMGDLISRLANDVGQLRAFYAFGLLQILNVIFLLVFTIGRMATIHATLTASCLIPLLFMFVISRYAMPRMHKYSRENQEALGLLTNRVTEAFVNVHVIQANAANESFTARAEVENERVFASNMKLVGVRTVIFPLMTCLAGFSQLIVLFYGGREVIAGRLSVGDILAFNVYIGLLTFPLTAMGMILSLYQRAKTALIRIGDIEAAPVETQFDTFDSFAIGDIRSGVTANTSVLEQALLAIRGLNFNYPVMDAHKERIGDFGLHNFNLQLARSQKIGLFGPIGSGKSTLFNVITRVYDPPPGTIWLNGRDVLSFNPPALRHEIGYAMQTVHLFSESIRENLTFGLDRDVSQPELDEVAAGAQILDEIHGFEHGWDTQIGEKGVRLSGGQKQRLALARLFLRQPPVLLLDDVLSAVDHRTEQRLIEYIYSLGCAVIIASHRGSALRHCQEVLILGEGQIIDRGTFAAMAAKYPDLNRDL